jgi:hypothetical protein
MVDAIMKDLTPFFRAPKVQNPTGRKECAYGQSLSNVGLGLEVETRVKPRPNPSATLRHETRNRHGQKSLLKPPARTCCRVRSRQAGRGFHVHRNGRSRRQATRTQTSPSTATDAVLASGKTGAFAAPHRLKRLGWRGVSCPRLGGAAVLTVAGKFRPGDNPNNAPNPQP